MFHNLAWSGVYLSSTLSKTLLKKVLTLVLMTATIPEVYVSTLTIFLSNSYYDFKETLTHMKSLKINIYIGETVTDYSADIGICL